MRENSDFTVQFDKTDARNPGELQSVSGTVDAVIYQSDETGYCVIDVEDDNGEMVTAVGTMPYVSAGEQIVLFGSFTHHPRFGRQFKVEYHEKTLPSGEADILHYLASGAVKGIGPKTAERIVEQFGEDTFDVIERHPEWLANIKGISAKKAIEIGEDFREKAGARSILMFCRDFFSPGTAMRIYKKWGGSAVDMIKNNPYKLCDEFHGIGFVRADKIAGAVGIGADSPERIRSGILYVLSQYAQREGHTCMEYGSMLGIASEMLAIPREKVQDEAAAMVLQNKIRTSERDGRTYLYHPIYFVAEQYCAKKLLEINRRCPRLDSRDAERFIERLELTQGITYASEQKHAIRSALSGGVMVLTGGPGTGKTTVVRALLSIFSDMGFEVALAAPTGRAVNRMSEATACEAKTIHRLLEMENNDSLYPRFARDHSNPLEEDVFIVDEFSMVDILLLDALLRAIRPGARLILIGDADQLPSVGAGNVLHDILSAGCFDTVRLTEIFRQSADSRIITNAHLINSGKYPDLKDHGSDFFFLRRENDGDIAKTVVDLYKNRLPASYGAEIMQKIQVISPSRRGEAGTENMNLMLQAVLNPPSPMKKEKKFRETVFREGDRVMQIRNDYSLEWEKNGKAGVGIFNGDIGIIREIDEDEQMMLIDFDDRITTYDFTLLEQIEHAYAVTVHKSQGSEYPVVIMPLYSCPVMLQIRNLLYTAVTRAQQMVILVGKPAVFHAMIDNNRQVVRNTGLAPFLVENAGSEEA